MVELTDTLTFLKSALHERIYPLMRHQLRHYLPDGRKLRVVDVFLLSMMPKEDKKNFMEVMELPMEIGAH